MGSEQLADLSFGQVRVVADAGACCGVILAAQQAGSALACGAPSFFHPMECMATLAESSSRFIRLLSMHWQSDETSDAATYIAGRELAERGGRCPA